MRRQRGTLTNLRVLALCAFACAASVNLFAHPQRATLVAGRVVDGAGRPVEGVEIKLLTRYPGMPHLVQSYENFKDDGGEIARLLTDKEGKFHTTTEYSLDKLRIAIGKKGYVGFTKAAALLKDPLVIYKSVGCKDVKEIENASDDNFVKASLVEVLASDEFELPFTVVKDCDFVSELFKINQRVRPALASFLDNRAILPRTAKLLSYFAEEEDRQLLLLTLESRKDLKNDDINEVRRAIAGGLVSPSSENEWKLLESIVTCEKKYVDDDNPIDVPVEEAALALAANGSDRALSILKAKSQYERPPGFESVVKLAIRWINKHPGPVEPFSNLKSSAESAARVFNYSGRPQRFRIDKTVTDNPGKKALVFCTVDAGGEYYYYELVFRRVNDQWVLKGIWPAGVAD